MTSKSPAAAPPAASPATPPAPATDTPLHTAKAPPAPAAAAPSPVASAPKAASAPDQLARIEDKVARIEDKFARFEHLVGRLEDRQTTATARLEEAAQGVNANDLGKRLNQLQTQVKTLPGFSHLVLAALLSSGATALLFVLLVKLLGVLK